MIVLVGGGGIPNYGDELIINNWLRWYRSHLPNLEFDLTVEGARRSILRNTFADRFPTVTWSHALRDARLKFRQEGFWGALEAGLNADVSEVDAVQRAFRRASDTSLFHIHGGGYINGKWPSHAFVLGVAATANAQNGTKAIATGIGLSPLNAPDAPCRELLDQMVDGFEFLEVRDQWSYDYLVDNLTGERRNKIIRGLDDAFLYPVPARSAGNRTLHLSLRDDAAGESIIERLSSRYVGSFDRHRFWVCKPDDAAAYVKLAGKFRFFELVGTSQLLEDPYLGPNDVMITERFHPHLQAARVGATGVYWSGSEYYDTKHGSLVELGSPLVPDSQTEFQRQDVPGIASDMAIHDPEYVSQKQAIARRALSLVRA